MESPLTTIIEKTAGNPTESDRIKPKNGAGSSTPEHLPLFVAIAGLVLTALHLWDLIESLEVLVSAGVMGAREAGGLDPSMMGKLVGEVVIAVVSRGLWTPIPAALLYIAWVPLGYRSRWFRMAMTAASIYFLQQLPVGTICGIVLIIAMRRHRAVVA